MHVARLAKLEKSVQRHIYPTSTVNLTNKYLQRVYGFPQFVVLLGRIHDIEN